LDTIKALINLLIKDLANISYQKQNKLSKAAQLEDLMGAGEEI